MSFGKAYTKIRFGKIRENPAGKPVLRKSRFFIPVRFRQEQSAVRKAQYSKEEGQEALDKLNSFLDEECPEEVYFLTRFWNDQQKAITYRELKAAIINGYMDEKTLDAWQHDYSVFVTKFLEPAWMKAMETAAANLNIAGEGFRFDPMWTGITDWIRDHGAQFVTNSTAEQRKAISGLIAEAHMSGESSDQLSRAIRPCIGLTRQQAAANQRYYNHVKETLLESHPKMTEESAAKKAQEKALQYAAEQHRYRAQVIATTEMAYAYNEGYYQAAKMAQAQGYLGAVEKVWSTAADEMVCPYCGGLEGTVIDIDDKFQVTNGKRSSFALTPPAHPNCRCAFEVREVAGTGRGNPTGLTDDLANDRTVDENEAGRLRHLYQEEISRENLRDLLKDAVLIGTPEVDIEMLQSDDFSKKFRRLTNNSSVNDIIRHQARAMLTHNSGTYTESLCVIDAETGNMIIQKHGKKNALEVALSADERKKIREYNGKKIGIHNHPTNIYPTGSDFVVAAARGYEFGMVVTHDGRVFKYTGPTVIVSAQTLDKIIDTHTKMLYSESEKRAGFERALDQLGKEYGITWTEIK